MEDLYVTGNGEPPYDENVRHHDSGRTVEGELAKLGLDQLGGGDGTVGCGD